MELKDLLKLIVDISEYYKIARPYVVGGLPRDIYMKKSIKTTDMDFTTNSPDVLRLAVLVADKINEIFELSEDGHVTIYTEKYDLDFSSHFVSDDVVSYLNGKFKGFEEAFSRDFTMNTLHQDLITRKIYDPTERGFKDIEDKIIRTPVPAEITLTDDPRRAYRAINLAARYDFKIDKDIFDFVLKNHDMFSLKNIKDKYVVVKISAALKANPEYTISLLKEMNLFKDIPLAGEFKNFLINNKMLIDYLEK